MSRSLITDQLPLSLKPFFQEYDFTQLNVQSSAATIIERVLVYGNRSEIRWLFQVYSHQQIKAWIKQWGNYALSEPHHTFWKLVLGVTEITHES